MATWLPSALEISCLCDLLLRRNHGCIGSLRNMESHSTKVAGLIRRIPITAPRVRQGEPDKAHPPCAGLPSIPILCPRCCLP